MTQDFLFWSTKQRVRQNCSDDDTSDEHRIGSSSFRSIQYLWKRKARHQGIWQEVYPIRRQWGNIEILLHTVISVKWQIWSVSRQVRSRVKKKKKRLRVSISIHDLEKEKTHSITQKYIHRSNMFFTVSVTTTISRLNQMSAKIRDWWKSSSKISTW